MDINKIEKYKNMDENQLNILKEYSLSDSDLNYVLNPDTKIHNYTKIDEVKHFDELLDNLGRFIILYPNNGMLSGHWCCLIKKGNVVEFFDPYGYPLDTQAKEFELSNEEKELYKMDEPRLRKLIKSAGYDLINNTYKFQKDTTLTNEINTCGRHCAARLILYQLDLKQYHDVLKKMKDKQFKDFDDIVTKFIKEYLHK